MYRPNVFDQYMRIAAARVSLIRRSRPLLFLDFTAVGCWQCFARDSLVRGGLGGDREGHVELPCLVPAAVLCSNASKKNRDVVTARNSIARR